MTEGLSYLPDKSQESFLIEDILRSISKRLDQEREKTMPEWSNEWVVARYEETAEKGHNLKEVREGW